MPDNTAGRRGLAATLAGLATRAAMLAGSVTVAVRLAVPPSHAPSNRADGVEADEDQSGRGRRGTPASRRALKVGHETEDMSAATMARVLITLAGGAAVAVALMLGFQSLIIPQREHRQASLTPQQVDHPTPPAPGLQADPVSELQQQRGAQVQLLNNYARIDPQHARIPIDRAMSLIVGRPLETPP